MKSFPLTHIATALNVDRNVSFRDFREIEGKKLRVAANGLFYTFQGEGILAGVPVVFLRLAGCNIGAKEDCTWCDTKFFMDQGTDMEFEDVMAEIKRLANGKTHIIVVTGGEPLLQTASLEAFRAICEREKFMMQVETNGYFVKYNTLLGHEIVVSPKIPHNLGKYAKYKEDWVQRRVSMKYVVTADSQSPYHTLPEDVIADKNRFRNIFVSAMCVYKRNTEPGEIPNIWDDTLIDREATARNYAYAASYALEHGFKVSYQTHLFGVKE